MRSILRAITHRRVALGVVAALALLALAPASSQGVAVVPTQMSLSASPAPAGQGTPITFTATVGPLAAGLTPSGTVVFNDGSRRLGAAPLRRNCLVIIVPCRARLTVSGLGQGDHVITATYEGDALSAGSSTSIVQVVTYSDAPDFSMIAEQNLLSAPPHGAASTAILTTPQGVIRNPIHLQVSGLPPGARAQLTPAAQPAGLPATLRIASGDAAVGSYAVTVTGTMGQVSHSTELTLRIAPPAAHSFALSVRQTGVQLAPGRRLSTTIATRRVRGGAGRIALFVTGLPPGAAVRVRPRTVLAGHRARLTIIDRHTPLGQYTLSVAGYETPFVVSCARTGTGHDRANGSRPGSSRWTTCARGRSTSVTTDAAAWRRATTSQSSAVGLTATSDVVDAGGPVLASARLTAIWWGTPSAFPRDARAGISSMLGHLHQAPYLDTANQYLAGQSVRVSFMHSTNDPSTPPARDPQAAYPSPVLAEIGRVLMERGWAPDAHAIYLVFASTFPRPASYCGFHGSGVLDGVTIHYAYLPNIARNLSGCGIENVADDHCNALSFATQSLANHVAHEIMETITDPLGTAWLDGNDAEIGDKGAWRFSGCARLGTTRWQLQKEWSNLAGTAVEGTSAPSTPGSPGAPVVSEDASSVPRLSWSRPAVTGHTAISGYEVLRGTSPTSLTRLRAGACGWLGNVTACTDTSATPGDTYFYAVRAFTSAGDGPASPVAIAEPTSAPSPG